MHREILQIESAGRIGRLCGAASGLPAKSIVDIRVAVAYFVIVSMAGFLFGGPVPNNIPLVPDHRFGLKIKADRSSA